MPDNHAPGENDLLRTAHENRQDVSDTYLALGEIPKRMNLSIENEEIILGRIRRLMEESDGIETCKALARDQRAMAQRFYKSNRIAAVDGTDSIAPIHLLTDTVYGAGVVAVTPGSHNMPRTRVTTTRAATGLAEAPDEGADWPDRIDTWANILEESRREDSQWMSAFREYEERELAAELLEKDVVDVVLIDGPILSHNLLSQQLGRRLFERLQNAGSCIGFIKEGAARPMLKAIGAALKAGEAYPVPFWRQMLRQRFRSRQQNVQQWIDQDTSEITRVIYKLNRKSYAVECSRNLIPLAFAILEHDARGPVDHDIPLLLQIADSQVRRIFEGSRARDEMIARYAESRPDRLIEILHERNLR